MCPQWLVQASLLGSSVKFIMHSYHIIYSLAFRFSFLISLYDCNMICKFSTTRTGPSTFEPCTIFTVLFLTHFGCSIMLLVRMFAEAFKIICSMSRDIVIALTFAFRSFTKWFLALRIQVLVLFESMITEALCFWPNHFAFHSIAIFPAQI